MQFSACIILPALRSLSFIKNKHFTVIYHTLNIIIVYY